VRQDLEDSGLSKDQIIRKAWETRDAAVKRKNAAEVELARERIGVMQVG
jgi:coiled-coil domain-containing protein 64